MIGLLLPPWVNEPVVLLAVLAILAKTVGYPHLTESIRTDLLYTVGLLPAVHRWVQWTGTLVLAKPCCLAKTVGYSHLYRTERPD